MLFKIHELDHHIIGVTKELSHCFRVAQIEEYLTSHPEIGLFAVLDDRYTCNGHGLRFQSEAAEHGDAGA